MRAKLMLGPVYCHQWGRLRIEWLWSSHLNVIYCVPHLHVLLDLVYCKGKCNHVGGVLFALEDFIRRHLRQHLEPLSCTSCLSVWIVPRNQSVGAKPLDQVLIRKIRCGKKNIGMQPKRIQVQVFRSESSRRGTAWHNKSV